MQECFIVRRGGTDASVTELSDHLRGTIQIAGNINPMIPIAGDVTPIIIPIDTPDQLLDSISLENANEDGTILITHNTTNEQAILYCKKNVEESQYTELVIPKNGQSFEITINDITYIKDSSNNSLTENGSKVFFLQRESDSQAYLFYKTDIDNYCPTSNAKCVFHYSDEDFIKENSGTILYSFLYYGYNVIKTNNGKAISFLANILNGSTGYATIFLIGKTQSSVEATNTGGTSYSQTWEQNGKTYYMNYYMYDNAGTNEPYINYAGSYSYVPFLGCQKPITLAENVYCLSNGFNFELIDRFGYLLEEVQED